MARRSCGILCQGLGPFLFNNLHIKSYASEVENANPFVHDFMHVHSGQRRRKYLLSTSTDYGLQKNRGN